MIKINIPNNINIIFETGTPNGKFLPNSRLLIRKSVIKIFARYKVTQKDRKRNLQRESKLAIFHFCIELHFLHQCITNGSFSSLTVVQFTEIRVRCINMTKKKKDREKGNTLQLRLRNFRVRPRVHFALLYAHVVAAVSVTRDIS